MRGLLIRQPWIGKIMDGQKTWEIRGANTNIRGKIGLIQSQTGTVVGTADLVDVKGPLTKKQMLANVNKHQIPAQSLRQGGMPYQKTYAWVLENAKRLRRPVPYDHPSGAVIWVKLPDESVGRRVNAVA